MRRLLNVLRRMFRQRPLAWAVLAVSLVGTGHAVNIPADSVFFQCPAVVRIHDGIPTKEPKIADIKGLSYQTYYHGTDCIVIVVNIDDDFQIAIENEGATEIDEDSARTFLISWGY